MNIFLIIQCWLCLVDVLSGIQNRSVLRYMTWAWKHSKKCYDPTPPVFENEGYARRTRPKLRQPIYCTGSYIVTTWSVSQYSYCGFESWLCSELLAKQYVAVKPVTKRGTDARCKCATRLVSTTAANLVQHSNVLTSWQMSIRLSLMQSHTVLNVCCVPFKID